MMVLRGHLLWLALNYLGGGSVALLIVHNSTTVDLTTISIILPLLVITYFTFRSSMGRIDDANRHVEQLNRMYMSTIETLAMAVDAKDQVTHGHIRRVQEDSVALARHIGVDDENLIKAIEAASLLHDIGKLSVPEHILNKPGKLTHDEFEVMKTHSSVGADILSAVEFPYRSCQLFDTITKTGMVLVILTGSVARTFRSALGFWQSPILRCLDVRQTLPEKTYRRRRAVDS